MDFNIKSQRQVRTVMSYIRDMAFALAALVILIGIESSLGLKSWWWMVPNLIVVTTISNHCFPENR